MVVIWLIPKESRALHLFQGPLCCSRGQFGGGGPDSHLPKGEMNPLPGQRPSTSVTMEGYHSGQPPPRQGSVHP